jgi:hypothetical protein
MSASLLQISGCCTVQGHDQAGLEAHGTHASPPRGPKMGGTPAAKCCLAEQRHKDHAGRADRRAIRHRQWDLSIALVGENGNRCEPFSLSDGGIWIGVRESAGARRCAERHRRGCRTHAVRLDSDLFALKAARKDSIAHTHLVRQSPSTCAGYTRCPSPYCLTITTANQVQSPPSSRDWSLRNSRVRRLDPVSGFGW